MAGKLHTERAKVNDRSGGTEGGERLLSFFPLSFLFNPRDLFFFPSFHSGTYCSSAGEEEEEDTDRRNEVPQGAPEHVRHKC